MANYTFIIFPGNNSKVVQDAFERRPWWKNLSTEDDFTTALAKAKPGTDAKLIYTRIRLVLERLFLDQGFNCIWKPTLAVLTGSTGAPVTLHSMPAPAHQQLVNHFSRLGHLTTKTGMLRLMSEYYSQHSTNVFLYMPTAYIVATGNLQNDPTWSVFTKHFSTLASDGYECEDVPAKHCKRNVWIVKPAGLNQGRGISVFRNLSRIKSFLMESEANQEFLIQKYLERPLLFYGRKFDVRCWVLVNNDFDVWFYRDGYLRTCSEMFTLDIGVSGDKMVHLTNYCMQKHSANLGKYEDGNTLSFRQFQDYLDEFYGSKGVSFRDHCIRQMKDMVVDSMRAACPQFHKNSKGRASFELFGYDFMLDEDFRVWMIEVNTNPYLGRQNEWHGKLVDRMIEDMMQRAIDTKFPPRGTAPAPMPPYCDEDRGDNMFDLIATGAQILAPPTPVVRGEDWRYPVGQDVKPDRPTVPHFEAPAPTAASSSSSGRPHAIQTDAEVKTKEPPGPPEPHTLPASQRVAWSVFALQSALGIQPRVQDPIANAANPPATPSNAVIRRNVRSAVRILQGLVDEMRFTVTMAQGGGLASAWCMLAVVCDAIERGVSVVDGKVAEGDAPAPSVFEGLADIPIVPSEEVGDYLACPAPGCSKFAGIVTDTCLEGMLHIAVKMYDIFRVQDSLRKTIPLPPLAWMLQVSAPPSLVQMVLDGRAEASGEGGNDFVETELPDSFVDVGAGLIRDASNRFVTTMGTAAARIQVVKRARSLLRLLSLRFLVHLLAATKTDPVVREAYLCAGVVHAALFILHVTNGEARRVMLEAMAHVDSRELRRICKDAEPDSEGSSELPPSSFTMLPPQFATPAFRTWAASAAHAEVNRRAARRKARQSRKEQNAKQEEDSRPRRTHRRARSVPRVRLDGTSARPSIPAPAANPDADVSSDEENNVPVSSRHPAGAMTDDESQHAQRPTRKGAPKLSDNEGDAAEAVREARVRWAKSGPVRTRSLSRPRESLPALPSSAAAAAAAVAANNAVNRPSSKQDPPRK